MTDALISSRILPIPHGFSTRRGGHSEGPYASLNLSGSVGDDAERVGRNLQALARLAGVRPSSLHTVTQVHGDRVVEVVGQAPPSDTVPPPFTEADALWTGRPGEAVGVRTADCVPILLADPRGQRVAAVHSGWKGTTAKIVARAVEALVAQGSRPEDLLAAIGPSIRACCYEVSPELGTRFLEQFGPEVSRTEGGKPRLDLAVAVLATLRESGVAAAHIELLPQCTSCEAERFYSHRRDRGVTGRQLSFAVCRFGPPTFPSIGNP